MRRRSADALRTFHLPATLATIALAACGGDATSPASVPVTQWVLAAVTTGPVADFPLAEAPAPTVLVTDTSGRAAAGVVVRFSVRDGHGVLAVTEAVADASGRASAGRWQLGPALGVQRVRAEVVGDTAAATEFVTTAIPAQGPMRVDAACQQPDSLLPNAWALPRTAERLARRQPVVVVAIGSSSTYGVGASVPDSAYPALLAGHLRRLYPASEITVFNAGKGGQQLDQLMARFPGDVAARKPHLVILQTGTVDAINGVPLTAFEAQLRIAIGELRELGAEVVLLDSQRYPRGGDNEGYRAFQRTMRNVADERGVPLARRFDFMTHWVERGVYTYPQMLSGDMFHPGDLTYSCTGRYLAEGVATAVRRWSGH